MAFHDFQHWQVVIFSLRHFVAFHQHEISSTIAAAAGSVVPRHPKDFVQVAERLLRLSTEEFRALLQKLETAPPDHYGSLTPKELGAELSRLKRLAE